MKHISVLFFIVWLVPCVAGFNDLPAQVERVYTGINYSISYGVVSSVKKVFPLEGICAEECTATKAEIEKGFTNHKEVTQKLFDALKERIDITILVDCVDEESLSFLIYMKFTEPSAEQPFVDVSIYASQEKVSDAALEIIHHCFNQKKGWSFVCKAGVTVGALGLGVGASHLRLKRREQEARLEAIRKTQEEWMRLVPDIHEAQKELFGDPDDTSTRLGPCSTDVRFKIAQEINRCAEGRVLAVPLCDGLPGQDIHARLDSLFERHFNRLAAWCNLVPHDTIVLILPFEDLFFVIPTSGYKYCLWVHGFRCNKFVNFCSLGAIDDARKLKVLFVGGTQQSNVQDKVDKENSMHNFGLFRSSSGSRVLENVSSFLPENWPYVPKDKARGQAGPFYWDLYGYGPDGDQADQCLEYLNEAMDLKLRL